jgi:hypothetical protein
VQNPLLSAAGCRTQLDGQHSSLRTNHGVFSRSEKPSEIMAFIFDEYEVFFKSMAFLSFRDMND